MDTTTAARTWDGLRRLVSSARRLQAGGRTAVVEGRRDGACLLCIYCFLPRRALRVPLFFKRWRKGVPRSHPALYPASSFAFCVLLRFGLAVLGLGTMGERVRGRYTTLGSGLVAGNEWRTADWVRERCLRRRLGRKGWLSGGAIVLWV